MNEEDELDDTLTNIRAVRAGVTSLTDAHSADQTRNGRLMKLTFTTALVVFVFGMLTATHMSLGISDIREGQTAAHTDIAKILVVTTTLAHEAEQAQAVEQAHVRAAQVREQEAAGREATPVLPAFEAPVVRPTP